jgi:thiamine biosynthesis protein ThiS
MKVITVKINGEERQMPAKGTIRTLAVDLGLNPETVLFVVNGVLQPEDYRLQDGDEVEVVSVVSGG